MRLLAAALVYLVACTTSLRVPPAVAPNVERELLERVVDGPAPPDDAVIFLVNEYLGERRLHEGYAFFRARAARSPDVPLFESLEGFFAVQLAPEVQLLGRVAYVERALAKLDDAARRAPRGPARLFRALVLARLPARFHRGDEAVRELELLAAPDSGVPLLVRRDVLLALAIAYDGIGRARDAAATLARSGYASLAGDPVKMTTQISVTRDGGTRYVPPRFVEEAPGVLAAYGFDYGEVYFVITDTGVVAIDSGAVPERAREIKARLRERTQLPITHVIFTHAHWDHAGGLAGLVEPGTKVIAHAAYRKTLAAMAPFDVDHQRGFIGAGGWTPRELPVDVAIDSPCTHVIGGVEFRLTPIEGAETPDSLIVEVPARKVAFAGDAIADLGVPFLAEGSPDGFLRGLALLARMPADVKVLHGHQPIGEFFPHDRLAAFASAFAELRDATLADLHAGLGEADILRRARLPDAIARDPRLAVTFLLFREPFVRRLVRERTGYWAMDDGVLAPSTRRELGDALDLVASRGVVGAVDALLARGDLALAGRVAEAALARHPNDTRYAAALRAAQLRLLERSERWDFFALTVYAQRTGAWIPPVPSAR